MQQYTNRSTEYGYISRKGVRRWDCDPSRPIVRRTTWRNGGGDVQQSGLAKVPCQVAVHLAACSAGEDPGQHRERQQVVERMVTLGWQLGMAAWYGSLVWQLDCTG